MDSHNEGPFDGYSSAHFITHYPIASLYLTDRLRPRRPVRTPQLQKRPATEGRTRRSDRAFPYRPLDPAKREIRLFELCPGKPGSKVVGRLFAVSLDEEPSFDALSYTWGSPRPSYHISINGHKTFSVGRNLRKALDDLRQPDQPRVLWTDAICIDQRNNSEKAHQIRLMRSIYSNARVVCAWLDHNVRPLDISFDDLAYLGKEIQIDDYDPSHWRAVADIFRNPYWRRLWIQQELILAKDIKIYCQRDVFDGQQLLEFQRSVNDSSFSKVSGRVGKLAKYINSDRVPGEVLGSNILMAKNDRLVSQRYHQQRNNGVTRFQVTRRNLGASLLQLFLQTAALDMTDPQDRVYGILGLASDTDESKVRVEYGAPLMEIYAQIFSLFIEKHESIDFLCFSNRVSYHPPPRADDFPTWMPHKSVDWSRVQASRACGSTTARNASIDVASRTLRVQGCLVDTIMFVGSEENFYKLPIRQWFPILEGYCRKLWPDDARHGPAYEREDVTVLLSAWLSEKRYRSHHQNQLERPTHETTVALLRAIRLVAEQVGHDRLTLPELGSRPRNDFLWNYTFMCAPLLNALETSVFVGTECRRLGALSTGVGAIEPGDQVWILHGCRMPVVLRRIPGKEDWCTVVGPAVFSGLMRGEALENVQAERESTVVHLQ